MNKWEVMGFIPLRLAQEIRQEIFGPKKIEQI